MIDASGSTDPVGPAGGTVVIRSGRLIMLDNSSIAANTNNNKTGAPTAVDINVTGEMALRNGAKINALDPDPNLVHRPTLGQGGEISVHAGSLSLTGGSQIVRSSSRLVPLPANLTGGGITVTATDSITIDGVLSSISADTVAETLLNSSKTLSGVTVSAGRSLTMTNQGTIAMTAGDAVNSGGLSITAGSLMVTGGATITDSVTTSSALSPAPTVAVTADSILLSGHDPNGAQPSGIFGAAGPKAKPNDILLSGVGSLTVTNGAVIQSGGAGLTETGQARCRWR